MIIQHRMKSAIRGSKYKLCFHIHGTYRTKGNDWHTTSSPRDKRQKQSVSVNSAPVRLCAPRGSCRLPYLRVIGLIAPLKSMLLIVPRRMEFHSCYKETEQGHGENERLGMDIYGRRNYNGKRIKHTINLDWWSGWLRTFTDWCFVLLAVSQMCAVKRHHKIQYFLWMHTIFKQNFTAS